MLRLLASDPRMDGRDGLIKAAFVCALATHDRRLQNMLCHPFSLSLSPEENSIDDEHILYNTQLKWEGWVAWSFVPAFLTMGASSCNLVFIF